MYKTSNKNKNFLSVTPIAINQFKKILTDEKKKSFVRILVDSGGCSGFSYKFSIDNKIDKKNDIILIQDKQQNIFVTDKVSLTFINSSSIDWKEDLTNSQFIVTNPIAKSSCGCGSSFSI